MNNCKFTNTMTAGKDLINDVAINSCINDSMFNFTWFFKLNVNVISRKVGPFILYLMPHRDFNSERSIEWVTVFLN